MPWFRIDDSFHSHPKTMVTSPAALGLWAVAGSWSSAHLTDGVVPDRVLPLLLPDAAKLARELVAAGLWERHKGVWKFHDWREYNPTKEAVEKSRANNARRQRRWQEAQHNGVSNAVSNGTTNSAPTRPDPSLKSMADVDDQSAGPNARATRIDQIIITEIQAVTGRVITAEWAATVRGHVLEGRHPADPVAYVRQAIRSEPDPSKRFLPQY